jgi:hypothetical protein
MFVFAEAFNAPLHRDGPNMPRLFRKISARWRKIHFAMRHQKISDGTNGALLMSISPADDEWKMWCRAIDQP